MDFASAADRAYANGAFIPGADDFIAQWAAQSSAFRSKMKTAGRARLDLAYGNKPRQALDIFLPETGVPKGMLVFIHGGFWLKFGREDWSHLAAGAVARGWACVLPSYTQAPDARITAMTQEMVGAIRYGREYLCEAYPEFSAAPVVITGHSAGGHLAARMGCGDFGAEAITGGPEISRIVAISPLSDLHPLIETEMQAQLRIDATEARAESPALLALRPGIDAHIWVGAQERPAFLWQARLLSENWDCPWTPEPGLHHYNICDGLISADSALTRACLDGL